ncbi:MurR/RpiR family transcriptional regulator [Paracoccus sp. (in: a-proteobacteria)]|uniref:MurR/RpiR family transcriptional regulator n=1 Tax=Paracoccus sp. TaxID=267 RepID=UPI00289EFE94|nr:MurR/RpiR family transcriptional regulator [Paracoccus sp. (in: a-proteobacteria)]
MDLFQTLSDEKQMLSKLDARIAKLVLENVDQTVQSSISDLAERVGVSAPTITRFCRRIGCNSYADFKVQLARMTYVGLRYLKPEVPTSTAAEVAEDIVTKAQDALFKLHQQLDLPAMERAAQLLRGASFIQAVGAGGNSSMIANEIQNRLFRLGCHVQSTNDKSMALMLAASATAGTVAIVSSMAGRDNELVRCLDLYHQNGVPTIAITQSGSPVAARSSVVIPIDLAEGKNIFRPTSTRFAYLAAIDVLANLVAYADRTQSLQLLRRIKEELVSNRDGDDRQLLGD